MTPKGIRVARKHLPWYLGLWMLAGISSPASAQGREQAQEPVPLLGQARTEIPYRDGMVILHYDFLESITKTRYRIRGHVVITFRDMRITCEEAEYDEATREGTTTGPTRFSQNQQWFTCSRSEFNLAKQTGKFYDATGYTDQQYLVQGKTVLKTGRDTYVVAQGSLTACLEKNPKWKFGVGGGTIRVDETARLRRVVFRLKGVPVLYFPYLIVPMQSKARNSGFLPIHYGNSNSKGKQFSLGYFQTLGPSADMTVYGDYFSLRGLGIGGIFRARPNQDTDIKVYAYGVNDKLDQGGALLVVDGVSQFKNGFRAVANVNVTSNFRFRQAFSEGFRSATISEEKTLLFATRNKDSYSANFSFERSEVVSPEHPLVIQKSPAVEFLSLGKPLGRLPLVFYLRAGADGLSRIDSVIDTPPLVPRLDFHPRLALRLPSLAGFSLLPTFGIRETYYGAHLSEDAQPAVITDGLHRQYTELDIELRTPELEKTYHSRRFGDFTHLIEPQITYRNIHGITSFRETIRFDDEDVIANTNEAEYGIVNRIIRRRETKPGFSQDFEFLSLKIAQKYYFDPTFGGAFLPGEPNQFYPLNTLTGFSATGMQRRLAPMSMSLRLTPKPGISWDVRGDYDTRLHRLRDGSISAVWQRAKYTMIGTYFNTNAIEPSLFQSHHIQGQFIYGYEQHGFSASVTMSYDLQTKTLLNSNSRLNYAWDCCGASLVYQQFNLGVRTESRFAFSFSLKGIGNFGTIRRPESLF
jgi:LPS-assembly protein